MAQRREITGYHEVRAAARDYENYSSNLQGDRDVRDYHQLPLEVDPPRHQLIRRAIQPLFLPKTLEPKIPEFIAMTKKLIAEVNQKLDAGETVEIGNDFALPYVVGCLTVIYNRPQDYDEWLSWGPDVWTAETQGKDEEARVAHRDRNFEGETSRSGVKLQTYLDRVFDEAIAKPNDDLWGFISQLEFDGVPITRVEMQGAANVMLAGGRDTVVKLITGMIWHLINSETDRAFLTSNPDSRNAAIDELLRFLTPLSKMERVPGEYVSIPDKDRDTSKYVLLSFVSANYDKTIWDNPEAIDLHRKKQPHMAFGFGPHTCMGMGITEAETRTVLNELLENWPNWKFAQEPDIAWQEEADYKYIDRFRALVISR
jgi:cytochrome P450